MSWTSSGTTVKTLFIKRVFTIDKLTKTCNNIEVLVNQPIFLKGLGNEKALWTNLFRDGDRYGGIRRFCSDADPTEQSVQAGQRHQPEGLLATPCWPPARQDGVSRGWQLLAQDAGREPWVGLLCLGQRVRGAEYPLHRHARERSPSLRGDDLHQRPVLSPPEGGCGPEQQRDPALLLTLSVHPFKSLLRAGFFFLYFYNLLKFFYTSFNIG